MKKAQLKKLSTEELVEKTRSLSAERARAIKDCRPRDGNRMFDILVAIERELRARGVEAQRQLLKLLDDPNPATRCWVAASVLEFAPAEGERVLTELASVPSGFVSWSAGMALEQWKAGTYKPL
ncbi:DUF2019 domain-containing protein [Archangium sp.]|uniref:DUF2019 domain-containing protein n=1 Tax=Archangium sp. TaxID=1872627 RepID=UPI00389A27AD